MSYTTQMDAARQGIITPEMKAVAASEHIAEDELRELIALGQVIIPANKNHKCLKPNGIGSRLRTKINVNLGTSRDWTDLDMEMEKVKSAVDMGAEAIMDLSSCGDTQKFRRKLTSECPATIGTVPIYDAVVYYHKALKDITAKEWLDIVRMHAEDGVDFMTIHCGVNKETAARFKRNKRLMNIVSRGGSIIFAWMEMTGQENPFYEYYDEVLDIFREAGYSRLPVYEGSKDHVVGIVYFKDVYFYRSQHRGEIFHLRDVLRKPFFTYETQKVSSLLAQMREKSVSFSIVLDEYGVTAGLITLEDIVEEIFGELRDEYDESEEDTFKELPDGSYMVSASLKLDDLDDLLHVNLDSEDYDSLGGYIIELLDHLPSEGEIAEDEHFTFKVVSVDKNRMETIHIIPKENSNHISQN